MGYALLRKLHPQEVNIAACQECRGRAQKKHRVAHLEELAGADCAGGNRIAETRSVNNGDSVKLAAVRVERHALYQRSNLSALADIVIEAPHEILL